MTFDHQFPVTTSRESAMATHDGFPQREVTFGFWGPFHPTTFAAQ